MTNFTPSDKSEDSASSQAIQSIEKEFDLSIEQVNSITHHILRQLRYGLRTQQPWQLPSFVTKIPNGSEKGTFLAIDLGGTNCRICSVDLHGDSTFNVNQTQFPISVKLRVNPSYKPLFAFIAAKLAEFIHANNNDRASDLLEPHRLGFTFSFTCHQTSLAQGTLIRWDKGWDIPEAVGEDPCALLQQAVDELELPVRVCVLANDSVGTLLTRAYISRSSAPTLAGVIFGTGTNAAYVEKSSRVTRLTGINPKESPGKRRASAKGDETVMVINTEWGSFFDEYDHKSVFPSTAYDEKLDAESSATGEQILEKRVSGMYLGELLRLVILALLERGLLKMKLTESSRVFQLGGIDTSFLSALAEESEENDTGLEKTRDLIESSLTASHVSLMDAVLMRRAAAAIVRRSARIAGAALAAIIIQSGLVDTRLRRESLTAREVALPSNYSPSSTGCLSRVQNAISCMTKKLRHALGMPSRRFDSSLPYLQSSVPASSGLNDDELAHQDLLDIGVDGSLFERYPGFEERIRETLAQITEIGAVNAQRIRIGLAKDGSGVGAALMAQAVI